MTIRVSVVVPTFKRPKQLDRCLRALLAQDFQPTQYEILIVDDADCYETKLQVEQWSQQARRSGHTIRYLPIMDTSRSHGPAAARNKGWRAACGKIIAFTDDDCLPERNWLREGVSAFVDEVEAVSGRIIVPLLHPPTDYERNAAYLEHSEFVTANCFYRREVLVMVGGFDEHFTAAWREDSDLFFTLLEYNVTYTYAPEAVVIHPVRPVQWGICLRQQRKSMFNALIYKKHPLLYRKKLQARPPWHYYGIVGALLAGLIGLVKGSRTLTYGGLCAWLALTAYLVVQRLRHTSHAPLHMIEMVVTSCVLPPLAIFWRIRGAIKFRVFFL